ncbi:hypothetical protein [Rhizobium leguminosarum]|uniref:hypothetical protein n=1 Tax=Rhizobium leguminosarum TaxID=384 RepID=UPI0013F17245|nr:hypothetical protein [Rhizobium leguminosarum]
MSLKSAIEKKIAADREAGREIPVVIEELILMITDKVDKPAAQKAPAKTESK